MMEREEFVVAVIQAAGGRLVGRVRLQKTLYLLEQLGLGTEFRFEYHHYGPYSRDLDNATADAKAFDLVQERFEHRKSDGAMFSVFETDKMPREEAYGDLGRNQVVGLVSLFARTNVTVLELAATVHWLWRYENRADWSTEVIRRKGQKVRNGRLELALSLLRDLHLGPGSPTPV